MSKILNRGALCILGLAASVALLIASLPASVVSAHVLKVDGDIGVTVHINPDDEPSAAQPTQIILTLQDKSGRLDPSSDTCSCTVMIRQDGVNLQTIEFAPSTSASSLAFTFPSAGAYTLEVNGAPANGSDFQSFKADFSYFVRARSAGSAISRTTTKNPLRKLMPFVAIVAASSIVILFLTPRQPRKRSKQAKGKP